MGILAATALVGAILTIWLLPEPKGLSLEVSSGESMLDESGHVVAG